MASGAPEEEEKGGPTQEDKDRIADTNVENLGGKEHRDAKAKAAASEDAWDGAGESEGLMIWRIEKFLVKHWPVDQYGTFYSGDSYIVLNTKVDPTSKKKSYDVFFWLGRETSQDEAGTAAYKTVELDDLLGDEPVQYREVQGNESRQFLDLFAQIKTLEGGIDSGFKTVKAKEYKPRLLHVSGYKAHVQVMQVALNSKSLNNLDSFVLDGGLRLFQYNGVNASAWERRKANTVLNEIKDNRMGKVERTTHIDGLDDNQKEAADFWEILGGKPAEITDGDEEEKTHHAMKMVKVSDESGKLECTVVSDGELDKDKLDSDDAFICDTGLSIYLWIGKNANKSEKRQAMIHAVQYLTDSGRDPNSVPICRVLEGKEPVHFNKVMNHKKEWNANMIKESGFVGRRSSAVVFRELQG